MQDDAKVMGLFRTSYIALEDEESVAEAFTLRRHVFVVWGTIV
jgi:hypothetical protein